MLRESYQQSVAAAASRMSATAVVMVSASISTQHAWRQPIFRFADTFVGVAIGVLAAWLDLRVFRDIKRPRLRRPVR